MRHIENAYYREMEEHQLTADSNNTKEIIATAKLSIIRTLLKYPFRGYGLTEKEAAVALLAAKGYKELEIARELDITLAATRSRLFQATKKVNTNKHGLTRKLIEQIEVVLD